MSVVSEATDASDRKKTYSTQASHKAPKKSFLRKGQGSIASNTIARPGLSSTIQERSNITPSTIASSIKNTVQTVKQNATPVVQDLKQKLANQRRGLKKKIICNVTKRNLTSQIPHLKPEEETHWATLLHAFTTRHQSHHRPLALVSSGGTATDLEVNAVRMLDNFSTGMRGAVSVEQFLKRGYAVIHLQRCGSASPYSRVLGELLGCRAGNHGLGFEALGRLFEGQASPEEEEELKRLAQNQKSVGGKDEEDPWLTSSHMPPRNKTSTQKETESKEEDSDEDYNAATLLPENIPRKNRMNLNNHILNSTILESKLRERAQVVQDGLLLTVPFRTVEEYLAKLKLCTEAMEDCQSMGLIYLTAAVSDFYIPKAKRALHKIQSRNYDLENGNGGGSTPSNAVSRNEKEDTISETSGKDASTAELKDSGELTLTLHPVPKVIPLIREAWAPHAFCVTFKLETDKAILYDKAKIAMKRYNVHLVIGNILATRHEQVWLVEKEDPPIDSTTSNTENDSNSDNYTMMEISRASSETKTLDELEDAMISEVVQKHFEYIASHYIDDYDYSGDARSNVPRTALMAGAEAAARHNAYLMEKRTKLQKELQWKRVRDMALSAAGHLLGMFLSYSFSSALHKRMKL